MRLGKSGPRRPISVGQLARHIDGAHLHAVLRERAGLVRADDRGGSERFDARQMAHERRRAAMRCAPIASASVTVGQQPFRHVRDDDADREHQAHAQRQADEVADDEDQNADRDRQHCDEAAEDGDLLLQRRRCVGGRLGEARDVAERRVHAGREDERLCFAGHHDRAGQQDVAAVQQVTFGVGAACHARPAAASPVTVALFTRTPNASSSRQSAGTSSPALRKITSPGTTSSDGMTTTEPSRRARTLMRQQPLQGGHRPLRPVFLPEGKGPVDQNDGHDGDAERGHALAGRVDVGDEGQHGGTPQEHREEMGELADEPQRHGNASDALDPIRSELREAAVSLR